MKPTRRSSAGTFALKTLPAAIAFAFGQAGWAGVNDGGNIANLPTGGNGTNVSSSGVAGNVMSIGISGRSVIDWATFNVGSGYTVNFSGAGNAVLNRVALGNIPGTPPGTSAPNSSTIAGAVNAPGIHFMLMNPNGILFTSSATVNVGSLVATTGRIDEGEFTSYGRAAITYPSGYPRAGIVNQGHISVEAAGLAALVAPSVTNEGVIMATGGKIILAGTDAATITMNGLYEFTVTGAGGSVTNAAGASLNGATIALSTGDAASVLSGTINLHGIQQATSAIVVNGDKVVLTSDLNAPVVSGNSNEVVVKNGAHIQDAVDIAKAGATIDVWGGTYTEGHANVDYFGAPGGGQNFGLHVYKDNLLIRGFKSSGAALSGLDDLEMPVVTAQFQTGFGAQHFVSGSGVTVDGLKFKPVATGDNKTFEVIGNDFTLRNSVIDNSGNATAAAFYISDFALPGRPEVETFHLQNNRFIAGTTPSALVVVASGAGNSSAASNRVFSGNQLIGTPGLAGARGFQIQGQIAGIPWQTFTAGAVTVANNTFSNFDAPVRTVGTLTQQLDWNSVLNGNTFAGGAALAFVGDTTTARAGTVTVAAQDGTGTSNEITDTRITRDIQSSINRAQSADTVRALAGIYAESLVITKALTLQGAGKGLTIIDPAGNSADGIAVSGNIGTGASVAIRDLTVQGGGNGIRVKDDAHLGTITLDGVVVRDNSSNGFISSNGGSNASTVENINILNSVFAGNGVAGGSADINLFRFNGNALVKNVDILGTRGPDLSVATDYGLQLRGQGEVSTMTAAGNVRLEDVRIAGNYRRAHLGIQRYSDASGIVMSGVQLGGKLENVSAGNGATLSVLSSNAGFGRFFSSDMGGALALGNTLFARTAGDGASVLDISIGGGTSGLRVDATEAAFGGIIRSHSASGADNFAIEDRVGHALDNAGIGGLVTWQAHNIYVTQASGSIQRGIDAACACDTVHVGAGTFAEQLRINKSLILIGAGADQTIVRPTSLVADTSGMKSILTIGGSATTDVEVSGFTFKGPVPEINAGIFVRDGALARIHDNKLIDIRESTTLSGNQQGAGIFVGRALFTTSGRAVIENNVITGYQKGGIVIDGPGSQATITGNTITGEGPTTVIAQNGIQVSRGANATLTGNTVRGNVYTGSHADPDDFASGILFFISNPYLGQGGITIGSGNTITANEFGVWTNDARTLATTSLTGVSGNTRNAVAYFTGGYAGQGPLLEYPAWAASNAALVNAGTFGSKQSGDIVDVGGALRVTGWSAFAAIQPAVNAVAAGASIDVAAGTYAESVVLNGARNLTFNNVTLQDLTINSGAAGSGIRGSVTANGSTGFVFNAPVYLLGDTSLATTGANITVSGDIQGFGGGAYALSLDAGAGNVTLLSGGTAGNPLGKLDVESNNFTLLGTLWVSGYEIDALGMVALSDHTLRSQGFFTNLIDARGSVTGSTIADGGVQISGGDVATSIFSLGNVTVIGTNVGGSITGGFIVIGAQSSVNANVNAQHVVAIHSGGPVNVSGSAASLVIDAPSGNVNGNFVEVVNTGDGVVNVNGKPQANVTLTAVQPQQIIPAKVVTAADAGNPGLATLGTAGGSTGAGARQGLSRAAELLRQGQSVEIDLSPGND